MYDGLPRVNKKFSRGTEDEAGRFRQQRFRVAAKGRLQDRPHRGLAQCT